MNLAGIHMTDRFQTRRILGSFTHVIYTTLFSGFWPRCPFIRAAKLLRQTHRIFRGNGSPLLYLA
jgi:hypothetical protein